MSSASKNLIEVSRKFPVKVLEVFRWAPEDVWEVV